MSYKKEIGAGIRNDKAELFHLLLGPLPGGNDLFARILEICAVLQGGFPRFDGGIIHGVGIKGILDVIQITDQFFAPGRKSDPHAGERAGLGKSLHHQEVLIFSGQSEHALTAEIDVGFIHNYDHIFIAVEDIRHIRLLHGNAGGRIRIRENDPAVLPVIVFLYDPEVLIQRDRPVGDPEQIRPYIIERIGDIRKQYRLFRIEEGQEAHGQHVIRPYPGKDPAAADPVKTGKSVRQILGLRVRISAQIIPVRFAERL